MSVEHVRVVDASVIDGGSGPAPHPQGARKPRKASWSLLINGGLFALLGVVCFAWPGLALGTIALIIGIGFLIGGVGSIVDFVYSGAFRAFSGWLLVSGIVEIILGLLFVGNPIVSIWVLSTFIAIAIIAVGALQILSAVRMRHLGGRTWMFQIATGAISAVLGILMIASPATLAYWISAFAVVYGVALILLAFKVPKLLD